MANFNFNPQRALDKEIIQLFGIVTFGASGAVSSQTSYGFTVTKPTGTGLYRITLSALYQELIGAFAGYVAIGGAADSTVQRLTTMSAAGVIDLQVITAGVAANAVSGDLMDVMVILKNSPVLP